MAKLLEFLEAGKAKERLRVLGFVESLWCYLMEEEVVDSAPKPMDSLDHNLYN